MKLGSTLLLFLLTGCLVACSTGAASDEPDDDSDTPGSGKSRKSGSQQQQAGKPPLPPGCAETASCTDRGTDGSLCRAPCDVACQKTHAHYSFWVNAFEVANSGGLGRHQGIAVLGVELAIDERIVLADRPELAAQFKWPETMLPELPDDIVQKMTDDGRFAAFAMCSAPKVVLDIPLFNHGRTLMRDAEHASNRIEMRSSHGDGDAAAADDPAVAGTKAWSAQTKSCLSGIKDGHCDAVCGNCSYVLPAASLDPMRPGDWSKAESLVSGSAQCAAEASYYGGPGQESQDSFLGNAYPNPFVHCAKVGCKTKDETPTISGLWWSESSAVSGRWGHNSNADAEAEYRAFTACISPGEMPAGDVCAACGTVRDPGKQDPCGDRTNTAAAWWDRTANLMKDFVPAIKEDVGDRSPAPPKCAWADFSVSGM